jgi:hypothetical protein
MIEEKILILYPTLVQAGLAITAFMEPTPLITTGSFDSPLSFYITMAVFLDSSKEYVTTLDVMHKGHSVLEPGANNDENHSQNFMFTKPDESSLIVGNQLLLKGVKVTTPGTYDINLELFEIDEQSRQHLVDEKTCSIVIVKTTLRDQE